MTDRYADAGIYYLPIDRIEEFTCLKDGREVLVRNEQSGEIAIATWHYCDPKCVGWLLDDDSFFVPTHFAPISLQPIGEHVEVEYGCIHTSGDEYSISGHSSFDAREWMGDGKRIDATVTIRVPTRKPPRGEAS